MLKMWMVRSGERGFLIDQFISKSLVAVGWDIGDLSKVGDLESIKLKLSKRFYYES